MKRIIKTDIENNTETYIFRKKINLQKNYKLSKNNDINYEMILDIYNKHIVEIYGIIIYFWVYTVHNKGEEEPALLKI